MRITNVKSRMMKAGELHRLCVEKRIVESIAEYEVTE